MYSAVPMVYVRPPPTSGREMLPALPSIIGYDPTTGTALRPFVDDHLLSTHDFWWQLAYLRQSYFPRVVFGPTSLAPGRDRTCLLNDVGARVSQVRDRVRKVHGLRKECVEAPTMKEHVDGASSGIIKGGTAARNVSWEKPTMTKAELTNKRKGEKERNKKSQNPRIKLIRPLTPLNRTW